jgi:hypothetical protein
MAEARKRRRYAWTKFSDEELLGLRFCDLNLRLERTPLARRVAALYRELERRGLRFRPHCWLSEEWFSPDGIPGIAIPFYLAHPRLTALEARQMFEVEGSSSHTCLKLLRHEAGHAICTAYRLHRRNRWRRIFGDFYKPYPTHYTPRPHSRSSVLNLDWWYAQSHPAEDFAETFAVWLRPRSQWRREYSGWPAMRKLEYVDELMQSIAGKTPAVRNRSQYEPLSLNRRTLRQHYEEKRRYYGIDVPELYDNDLLKLFSDRPARRLGKRSAAAFLRRIQPELCQICSRYTGENPYTIAQLLQEMILRCREMKLYLNRPEWQVKIEVATFVCVQTLTYLHEVHHRIPV